MLPFGLSVKTASGKQMHWLISTVLDIILAFASAVLFVALWLLPCAFGVIIVSAGISDPKWQGRAMIFLIAFYLLAIYTAESQGLLSWGVFE